MGGVAEIAYRTVAFTGTRKWRLGRHQIFSDAKNILTGARYWLRFSAWYKEWTRQALRFPVVEPQTGQRDVPADIVDTCFGRRPILEVNNLTKRFDIHTGLLGKLTGARTCRRERFVKALCWRNIVSGWRIRILKIDYRRCNHAVDRTAKWSVWLDGREILDLNKDQMREMRKTVQMIF
jgi:peptide/nickel transport system ATP-binding protein